MVLSSSFGIFAVGVIVAVASIWPLALRLKNEEERFLSLALNTKTAVVEEYLTRAKDISAQIASRTAATEKLASYNRGEIPLSRLTAFLGRDLSDAISHSHEIWGLTRLDAHGRPVAEVGLEIPPNAWPDLTTIVKEPIILGPITLVRRPFLIVAAPILNHEGIREGTDLILFRLFRLRRIIEDITGLGQTGETIIGVVDDQGLGVVFPFRDFHDMLARRVAPESALGMAMTKASLQQTGILLPGRDHNGSEVIAYGPIHGSHWGIAIKMDQEELYAPVYRHILATGSLIVGLILLGTVAMVLLLRPVAGRIIIHTDELMSRIHQSTASLEKELQERKRIEQWLRDSERRYRVLVEEVPDVIFILDDEGRFTYTNTQVETFLECPVQEILDKPLKQYVVLEDQHKIDLIAKLDSQSIWDEEVSVVTATGAHKWARIRCKAAHAENGGLLRFEGVMRDITRRKGLEEEVRISREELLEKIRIIDDLYEHLVQSGKAKAIASHTAEVAHELRQPLAIIGGFARRMDRKLDGAEVLDHQAQKEYCRIMIDEIQRLEKILASLLDFTRRESLRLQTGDPNVIIQRVLQVYEGRVREKNLTLEVSLGQEMGEILLDPDRFEQVVRNLVSNAMEASPAGGLIRVVTGASIPSGKAYETGQLDSEGYFEMKIHNFGKTIPPEDLQKIFSPFFTTKNYGTGIGLTLAKRIVEDHRGSISVKSDSEGTVFTVWLPLPQPESVSTAARA